MRARGAAAALALGLGAAWPGAAGAQRLGEAAPTLRPPACLLPAAATAGLAHGCDAGARGQGGAAPARAAWLPPVASLIVPGSGQLISGRARGLIYVALEVWLVARAVQLDRKGDDEARQYRDIAFNVARRSFTASRRDGPFEYYETMEKYVESGVFDLDPGPGFLPEPDTATFNGSVWALARRTFFARPDSLPAPDSPQYLAALAFYRERAATDEFRWSWRDARLEQDVFRGTIRASDDAYRQRTNILGALVLNHLASAIDALLSERGRRPPAVPRVGFRAAPDALVIHWRAEFRVKN